MAAGLGSVGSVIIWVGGCVLGYGRHLEMMGCGDVGTLPVYIT